ncbi:Carboxy-S-adenosyl-L-methionine synthase [Seminavis robusta]|uniref:Carboxy-S-adenosyl-L-methionine synthase n=1 Tax=Seminavis robusta TaxID=568900 RepID=A0A9N8EGJ5_9STRA|nr:Carboxy-S-adenosyl-L-methionine synthase [Seminavis robusta]|eukprot:Sro1049_g235300.1 Carboxy-S-adenosyl-L-methionine synthase (306) ;mRNA; f:1898-2815
MFLRPALLSVAAFVTKMDMSGLTCGSISVPGESPIRSATAPNNEVDAILDPAAVWKEKEVANAFTDIRESVPLAKEQLDLMVRIIKTFHQPNGGARPFTWLDLGCGDGPLGRALLEAFPDSQGTFLDFSEPMLETAKSKIDAMGMTHRVSLVQGDLSSPRWMEALNQQQPKVDAIVSGFAIHHLTNERKQALYQELYDMLSPGGVFLNLEHVASPSLEVEKIFDGAFVDSMHRHFEGAKTYEECEQAVYYDLNVDAEANIVVSAETQCEWLRSCGFQHVDIYLKYLILALFGGVKKQEDEASAPL